MRGKHSATRAAIHNEKGNAAIYTVVQESVNHHGMHTPMGWVKWAATRSLFQSFIVPHCGSFMVKGRLLSGKQRGFPLSLGWISAHNTMCHQEL